MKILIGLICTLALISGCDRRDDKAIDNPKAVEVDNTGRNQRDQNANTVTPMDQGNNERDLKITQEIRRAIVARDDLSMAAKNIKVVSVDGVVTLRGPVESEAEKQKIATLAQGVSATSINNQLEVKAE